MITPMLIEIIAIFIIGEEILSLFMLGFIRRLAIKKSIFKSIILCFSKIRIYLASCYFLFLAPAKRKRILPCLKKN